MVTLAFVPTLVGALVGYALLGRDLMLGLRPPDFSDAGVIVSYVLVMVISLAIYGVTVALLVQLAYDVKIGRRGAIAGYIGFDETKCSIGITITMSQTNVNSGRSLSSRAGISGSDADGSAIGRETPADVFR